MRASMCQKYIHSYIKINKNNDIFIQKKILIPRIGIRTLFTSNILVSKESRTSPKPDKTLGMYISVKLKANKISNLRIFIESRTKVIGK